MKIRPDDRRSVGSVAWKRSAQRQREEFLIERATYRGPIHAAGRKFRRRPRRRNNHSSVQILARFFVSNERFTFVSKLDYDRQA